jgi:hypothetical protein
VLGGALGGCGGRSILVGAGAGGAWVDWATRRRFNTRTPMPKMTTTAMRTRKIHSIAARRYRRGEVRR